MNIGLLKTLRGSTLFHVAPAFMTSSRIGHLLGIIGSVIVVLFWAAVLAPASWQAHFPGEGPTRLLVFLAFLATIFACVKASRGWLISVVVSCATNLLLLYGSGV